MVIVMRHWGNYRIPVDFAMVHRQDDPRYRAENRLCRWMLVLFRRPAWAQVVMVVAEAALASIANLQLIRRRGSCCVMASARTWCFENGPSVKALVRQLPNKHYRRCWVPLEEPGRRRTYWTSTKRARLRHRGDVTSILSQPRRNPGPQPTKILVTNLPDATARQVVDIDRRRWSVALLMKARKGATGLGQQQITKEPPRVERSVAIALMASLLLRKCRAQDIPPRGPWSVLTLKRHVTWQIAQGQIARSVEQRLRKGRQERKAA
jgi:hypothetical protein